MFIGSICAYGGFNWITRDVLGRGNYVLFGTQLIPWTCGTLKYGKLGVVYGAKRMLRVATESGTNEFGLFGVMQTILQIRDIRPTDFLACCLWPNNPSLHPPILYGLFEHWDGKSKYTAKDNLPVWIYKDLRTNSSKYIVELDNELVSIVAALSKHYPTNPHMQEDFSMKTCVLENYKDQVLNAWDTGE